MSCLFLSGWAGTVGLVSLGRICVLKEKVVQVRMFVKQGRKKFWHVPILMTGAERTLVQGLAFSAGIFFLSSPLAPCSGGRMPAFQKRSRKDPGLALFLTCLYSHVCQMSDRNLFLPAPESRADRKPDWAPERSKNTYQGSNGRDPAVRPYRTGVDTQPVDKDRLTRVQCTGPASQVLMHACSP